MILSVGANGYDLVGKLFYKIEVKLTFVNHK